MPLELLKWFTSLGGTAVMVFFGWAVATGRLVLRRELTREENTARRNAVLADYWQRRALEAWGKADRASELAVELADRAVATAAKLLDQPPRQGG